MAPRSTSGTALGRLTPISMSVPLSRSALDPELRLSRTVVGSFDVPVLAQRVLVHRGDEIERRLELDVIETGVGSDEAMPAAGRNQHEALRADRQRLAILLDRARTLLDQVEVLRCDPGGL